MKTLFAGMIMTLLLLAGCASQDAAAIPSAPHAECLVCKHNADLACVEIPVNPNTPRASYEGREYYFCSDDCRETFERNPSMYVRR